MYVNLLKIIRKYFNRIMYKICIHELSCGREFFKISGAFGANDESYAIVLRDNYFSRFWFLIFHIDILI